MLRETGGRLANFNGRGGLEIIENLDGGNAGIIPAPEIVDRLIAIYRAWCAGEDAKAEAAYREILPVLTLVMQGIDSLLIYGKRLAAQRLGLPEPIQRNPALKPTALGLTALARWSKGLGPL
jgi:4-hydroxy-tetrahydrodipicolinate synthase